MKITSPNFKDGEFIPAEFSRQGGDRSPALQFSEVPAGTESLALICHDPDAVRPGGFTHWVVWNIPASESGFSNNSVPVVAVQGKTDWGENKWGGPQPPSGTHRYYFYLYALDTTVSLLSSAGKAELEQAMNGHILATASLRGLYST